VQLYVAAWGMGNVMIILRILGITMVLVGIVFCITIIGAAIGIPMIVIGAILALIGKKRSPIVVHLNHDPPR
jgi:Family of unknown function (DUF5362)